MTSLADVPMQSYASGRAVVWNGDCMQLLSVLTDNSVDSIVTDPPYGLGFMGKKWDALPPGEEWARECLRVLKPGGHLLAFGGSRTWHRLAVAIEDAGFEIRDSIAWLYGSGFPKSLDVSKAIDKAGGDPLAFRRFARAYAAAIAASPLNHVAVDAHLGIKSSSCYWAREDHRGGLPPRHHWEKVRDLLGLDAEFERLYDEAEREITGTVTEWADRTNYALTSKDGFRRDKPATESAEQWQGWGTALKPAFEPVVVGRKPLDGTVAANVLAHGTGALNIDGCRIEGEPWKAHEATGLGKVKFFSEGDTPVIEKQPHDLGRWPANVVLDESQAAELDRQAPRTGASAPASGPTKTGRSERGSMAGHFNGTDAAPAFHADSGGASRFFYVAKAPKSERPVVDGVSHPTVKPLALMRWVARLVTPPGGLVLDTFAGSGTTGEAALLEGFRVLLAEAEAEYLPLIDARLRRAEERAA